MRLKTEITEWCTDPDAGANMMTSLVASTPAVASLQALPLRCRICHAEYEASPTAICADCLGPLEPWYDPARPLPDGTTIILHETQTHPFNRSFELPEEIDTNRIAAELKDGILRIRLPKVEKVKPQEIRIS